MQAVIRFLLLALFAVFMSLALLLFITYRNMAPAGELEIKARYSLLVLKQAPEARLAAKWFGNSPPDWVQILAVVWERANPKSWWWLPLVFIALRYVLLGMNKRRMGRG